jgi:hypothetical protein
MEPRNRVFYEKTVETRRLGEKPGFFNMATLDTALGPFSYPKIINLPRFLGKHCPINYRETARRRVLTVGNINSDATGFDIKLTPIDIPDLFKKSGIISCPIDRP